MRFSLTVLAKNKKRNEIKIHGRGGRTDFHVKVLAIHQYFTINNHCPRHCDKHFKIASSYILATTEVIRFYTLIDGKSFNLKTSLCFKSYNTCCIPGTLSIKPCVMLKYKA